MTGADKTYCEGCGHMARYGSGIEPTCDYLIHTGRRRPCAYGVGCTAHTRGARPKKLNPIHTAPPEKTPPAKKGRGKIDKERAREMFRNSASDDEIAAAFGVTRRIVVQWRYYEGLARKPGRKKTRL